jgi:hypothetical protein
VRVFQFTADTNDSNGGTWNQLGQDIDGDAAYDNNGYSVSLSSDGKIVAIGAPYNDNDNGTNSGQVRVFQFTADTNDSNGGTWNQLGQSIDGDASGDESGFSVSLSSDGKIVAIGAPGPTDLFLQSLVKGQVRVFQFTADTNDSNGGTWNQLGQSIDGDAASDRNGWSVSLSSDGKIVTIGAPYNSNRGQVRVYKLNVEEIELEEIVLEVVSDNLSVNAARALARIQLQIQEGVDATKGKLLLQILGTILQNNRDVDKNGLIIQMIASLNGLLNRM